MRHIIYIPNFDNTDQYMPYMNFVFKTCRLEGGSYYINVVLLQHRFRKSENNLKLVSLVRNHIVSVSEMKTKQAQFPLKHIYFYVPFHNHVQLSVYIRV